MKFNSWVDVTGTNEVESGKPEYPYNKVKEGIDSVKTGGTIYLANPGSDLQPVTITKNVKLRAVKGPVKIGH